jgi:hypothetical protein
MGLLGKESMITTIECRFCFTHFDERDVQFIGKYPNAKEACPDCVKRINQEDDAIDRALVEVMA